MKNTFILLLLTLVFISCKEEKIIKPDVNTEENFELKNVPETPIQPEKVREIVEKKVEQAKSAEDVAREKSPFYKMSCNEVLSAFEKDIKAYMNDSTNQELDDKLSLYYSDIISNRDCVEKDEDYATAFGNLKKKLAEYKMSKSSQELEDDEY